MHPLQAAFLGLVEGLTEFIPVSSTGHLIIVGRLLKVEGDFVSTFEVFIQLGAILAVIWLYKSRFIQLIPTKKSEGFAGIRGLALLAITTLPALFAGFFLHDFIKEKLFNPATVALGLGVGGVAILLVESARPAQKKSGLDGLDWKDALAVGLFQCLAMWPGVSRSAATIVGAMMIGVERKTAAEYSFFAAVPVMFAATLYDLYKSLPVLNSTQVPVFAIGFIVAFISACLAIKFFIQLLQNHTLVPFAWYRIAIAPFIFFLLHR